MYHFLVIYGWSMIIDLIVLNTSDLETVKFVPVQFYLCMSLNTSKHKISGLLSFWMFVDSFKKSIYFLLKVGRIPLFILFSKHVGLSRGAPVYPGA